MRSILGFFLVAVSASGMAQQSNPRTATNFPTSNGSTVSQDDNEVSPPQIRQSLPSAPAQSTIGQRRSRGDAAPNVQPLVRISGRVANRVQNRIRNRIDRFYDPQANAASPFRVASDQARRNGR
jgi:hypothetical protein